MNRIDLEGRVAVVTGGAMGIGRATAERFAASGAKVELWDMDKAAAEATAQAIGPAARARQVDVTDMEAVAAAAAACEAETGPPAILVTSAGIAGPNAKTWIIRWPSGRRSCASTSTARCIAAVRCCLAWSSATMAAWC